ncbi:MAG: hypothetical protein NZ960_06415 [Candidatus Kapabacteria bacterium]|nr:hypothetical protein [Candidatus Kapabacteria bacterium]MDW8011400.1 histidine kinase dimerization/phospho-acceptor domain-containing protein [Bacteroidota bacterium]
MSLTGLELLAVKARQHDGWRIIEVGTDITERKQAEERIQYLANFSELSPIPIVELTPDGTVTYANPAANRLLPVHELSPIHPWLEGIWEQLPAIRQSPEKPWIREVVLGEHAWLQHIFWLPTYQRLRIYAPEITLQHHLRRQLQEALEHEQELAVARSRLMSTIAHEFRTPLAGIQFSVELLQNYFDRLSAAERQQELRNIAARVYDLTTLVADFLNQSSLDALRRSLIFEPVPLQTVCQEANERIQPLLTAKAQQLLMELPEEPVYVRGDPKVLRFILLNLKPPNECFQVLRDEPEHPSAATGGAGHSRRRSGRSWNWDSRGGAPPTLPAFLSGFQHARHPRRRFGTDAR